MSTRATVTLGQGDWQDQPADYIDRALRTNAPPPTANRRWASPHGTLGTDLVQVRLHAGGGRHPVILYRRGGADARCGGCTLANWDGAYRLALADEIGGGRPWLGEYHLAAVYDRELTAAEVGQNFGAGANPTEQPTPQPTATHTPTSTPTATPVPTEAPPDGGRVTDGLQALYIFDEGSGTTVRDRSGVGAPLDLTINNAAGITWQPGVLTVKDNTAIVSTGAASKIIAAAQATDELTLEAWIAPANLIQEGPPRIVTISNGEHERNVTLGQGQGADQPSDYIDVRLRTTTRTTNGKPSLSSPHGTLSTILTHVVYTRAADGTDVIYLDGVEQARATVDGTLSGWDAGFALALAAEPTGAGFWWGDYDLVAIYKRALTPIEVQQNYHSARTLRSAPQRREPCRRSHRRRHSPRRHAERLPPDGYPRRRRTNADTEPTDPPTVTPTVCCLPARTPDNPPPAAGVVGPVLQQYDRPSAAGV